MWDVGIGNGLIIFFLMFMTFSFVAFLINCLVSCCGESLGDDTDPNANIIAASLNSRLNRETSHYRFRYDIPYDADERRATPNQAIIDPDLELPAFSDRYGYPLPSPPPDHLNVSQLSRAASHRSTHSSISNVIEEAQRNSVSDASNVDPSEEPPPTYDEIVGMASSFI